MGNGEPECEQTADLLTRKLADLLTALRLLSSMQIGSAIYRSPARSFIAPMTPASHIATPEELAAPAAEHAAHALHAPPPGATARLIHDLRELFKVKVVGLVLVTGWGGFYLGSMQSGISSVQRGLLDALLGIGLVSAGAGALNEALERKTDARMKRTADRPLASGRFPLAAGIFAGLGALALGAVWLALHTNLLTVSLALLTAFTYVAIYTPLKRVTSLATFVGAFPGAMGPMLGWTAARLCQANSPVAWRPDILHTHDWQTGLASAYLKAWGEPRPGLLFTIHNMAYQGLFPSALVPRLGLPWSFYTMEGFEYWSQLSYRRQVSSLPTN